jgi:hypothetical protein
VYVYRDNGEPDEAPAPASPATAQAAPDEQDAAYWYGVAEPEQPEPEQEVRGPFEPLVTSSTRRPEGPEGVGEPLDVAPRGLAPSAENGTEDENDDQFADEANRHAQKLEQIKDFYLTAEAIGEQNVDKHFDQLLAQQRELISEYFKHSNVRTETEQPQDGTTQAETAST